MKTTTLEIKNITVQQLEKILQLKEQIAEKETQIHWVLSGGKANNGGPKKVGRPLNSKMTPESRAKIATAQKARWERVRNEKTANSSQTAPVSTQETGEETKSVPSQETETETETKTKNRKSKKEEMIKA